MAQISLYIEDVMIEKLQQAAKEHNTSISKYVAALVKEQLTGDGAEEARKKQALKELRGALNVSARHEFTEIVPATVSQTVAITEPKRMSETVTETKGASELELVSAHPEMSEHEFDSNSELLSVLESELAS